MYAERGLALAGGALHRGGQLAHCRGCKLRGASAAEGWLHAQVCLHPCIPSSLDPTCNLQLHV